MYKRRHHESVKFLMCLFSLLGVINTSYALTLDCTCVNGSSSSWRIAGTNGSGHCDVEATCVRRTAPNHCSNITGGTPIDPRTEEKSKTKIKYDLDGVWEITATTGSSCLAFTSHIDPSLSFGESENLFGAINN